MAVRGPAIDSARPGGSDMANMENPISRGPAGNQVFRRNANGLRGPIPNARIDNTGQLAPVGMNQLANDPARNQLMVASLDSDVPILYGGPERLAGKLYIVKISGSTLTLALILCEGEVDQIGTAAGDTTNGIFLNDVDLAGGSTIVIRKHVGTAGQAADAILTGLITTPVAFTEPLANTAYVVVQVPAGATTGYPRLVFTVKGKKVFDPRQNLLPFSNLFSSWTASGTCSATQSGTGPYGAINYAWLLNDTDAAATSGRTIAFTIVSGATSYAWSAKVRKTTGGVSKTAGINVSISGGVTPVNSTVRVNTDTGATNGGTGVTAVQVGSATDPYWLVSGTVTDNASGNNALGMVLLPATAAFGSFVDAVATTGSATFTEAQVRRSTLPVGYVATPTAAAVDQPTVWSNNSALCLGDFLASTTYGEGRTVNAQSLATAAEYCDEVCGAAGATNEARSTLTLLLDNRQGVRNWRDVLRAYVPCWVVINNGQAYLRLDRDEPVDYTFTSANIRQAPLPEITRSGIRDTPNAVVISYTDTTVTPYKTKTTEATTGASTRRATRIDMPGIRSISQAKRMATLRLNHYTLEDLTGVFGVFDEGLKVLDGDLIQITDDVGLTAQKARVLAAADESHGRWRLRFRAHDPAVFTNLVVATPTSPSTLPPDPNNPPAITGLALTADRRLESGVWVSRIRATWDPLDVTWPFVRGYIVEIFDPATNATYTWAGGVIEVTSAAHGLALNDFMYLDFTSGGATIDGGYSVTNVPGAGLFRTGYAGGGAGGNVTWRKMREHEIITTSNWISQPVLLDVNYSVRVRAYSTSGVVGP